MIDMSVPRDPGRKKIVEKALKDLEPSLRESARLILGEGYEGEEKPDLKKSKRNEPSA
ncbi:MAG: hypothetical protein QXL34_03755 [Thermosphaera sp.]